MPAPRPSAQSDSAAGAQAGTKGGSQPRLKITLVKSTIGYSQRQKDTARALGLRKLNQTVVRPDNPQMRGMVFAIQHLVRVEEVDDATEGKTT
jgi:large subunit ribosomal protein L30